MLTLAIIPARGGSKGVKRKNLRCVGGKSLVQRAVESAFDSGVVDRVLVSTEDSEIRNEGIRCGAEVPFLRPASLATDEASTIDVVVHAIAEYEDVLRQHVKTVVLLEPTSPFRRGSHVKEALSRYLQGGVKSVVSVCPLERKPENIFMKGSPTEPLERYIKDPRHLFTRRQEMSHLCRLNSAVYVGGRDEFLVKRTLIMEPVGYVEMSAQDSLNIDNELDLMLAELIAHEHGL